MTDLHRMGELLLGALEVEAQNRRLVDRLSRWITARRSHRGCHHLQGAGPGEEAEDTAADGESMEMKISGDLKSR